MRKTLLLTKSILPGYSSANRLHAVAGKELYTEWKTEPENVIEQRVKHIIMDDFMKEEYNDLFTTTQCPTQQQLLDYVQDRLAPEQQHEVELHLADCELCSEAVEGLAAFEQKEQIPGML